LASDRSDRPFAESSRDLQEKVIEPEPTAEDKQLVPLKVEAVDYQEILASQGCEE